jgi:hypothetical protein
VDLGIATAFNAVAATHAAVGLADTEPAQEVFKHAVVPFRLELKMNSPLFPIIPPYPVERSRVLV